MGVTVYFPDGGRDLIYLEIDGQWVEYAKSVPRLDVPSGPDTPSNNLHWAGYSSDSSQEITREPKHRVYYDPTDRPDLFTVKDGEPPTLPLPVLDLNSHAEDPDPWLDPETGIRFSADQARTITKLLRYSPRKAKMTAWDSAQAEASQAVAGSSHGHAALAAGQR